MPRKNQQAGPPPRRRRVGGPGPDADADATSPMTAEERAIRAAYVAERSAFESLRSGVDFAYTPPRALEGAPATMTDAGAVLRPARKSEWRKLAEEFARRKWDPVAYIRAQFRAVDSLGVTRPPEPGQLLSDRCVARWKKARASRSGEVLASLEIQKGIARRAITSLQCTFGVSQGDASANVLHNPALELSALFRYCLASSIGGLRFRRIARRYEASAAIQYQRDRKLYRRHWGAILPDGFDERSATLYEGLYRGQED